MRLLVIQDSYRENTGVFIPIKDWALIKTTYPDIETIEEGVPEWEKDLIDERLLIIAQNPDQLKPVNQLFDQLKSKI